METAQENASEKRPTAWRHMLQTEYQCLSFYIYCNICFPPPALLSSHLSLRRLACSRAWWNSCFVLFCYIGVYLVPLFAVFLRFFNTQESTPQTGVPKVFILFSHFFCSIRSMFRGKLLTLVNGYHFTKQSD